MITKYDLFTCLPLCLGKHQHLVYSFMKIPITASVHVHTEMSIELIITCVSLVSQHTGSPQGQGRLLVQSVTFY